MKRMLCLFLGALVSLMPGLSFGGSATPEIRQGQIIFRGAEGVPLDVPYVPTEDYFVEEMFKLADLRDGDILYDLGCGDGRIVIAAVKRKGVRGVGVDIDPGRIAESKAKALRAHVADRTTFLQQDLFQSDIREATVVTIFLLFEINMRLRPKLFSDLKPGTRIVSHNFDMGDWKPDKTASLGLWEDGFHTLYSWIIPANASGLWTGQYKGESLTLLINQKFQRIVGSLLVNKKAVMPLSKAEISGEKISFTAEDEGQGRSIRFEGTVRRDVMEGTFKEMKAGEAPWKAVRDSATISWIE